METTPLVRGPKRIAARAVIDRFAPRMSLFDAASTKVVSPLTMDAVRDHAVLCTTLAACKLAPHSRLANLHAAALGSPVSRISLASFVNFARSAAFWIVRCIMSLMSMLSSAWNACGLSMF